MPRKVRVATVALAGRREDSVEANRESTMALLDRACMEDPDLVCLPECFPTVGVEGEPMELAEKVPGPTTDAAAKRAREHRAYVICPLKRREGERMYNSAVLLDRKGAIAGVYDKMHPVDTSWKAYRERLAPEFERGTTPGTEAPVFDLDFGKVGIQICFDLGFDRGWDALDAGGAELIVWASAFDGGFHLRARAYRHECYLVSSVKSAHAAIINPLGEVLERTGTFRQLIAQTIDLDYLVGYFDWQVKKLEEAKEQYGKGVTVRVAQEEGRFLVETNRDDLLLADLTREFDLRSSRDYHAWHTEALDRLRDGGS